jgi:hypothetical protein
MPATRKSTGPVAGTGSNKDFFAFAAEAEKQVVGARAARNAAKHAAAAESAAAPMVAIARITGISTAGAGPVVADTEGNTSNEVAGLPTPALQATLPSTTGQQQEKQGLVRLDTTATKQSVVGKSAPIADMVAGSFAAVADATHAALLQQDSSITNSRTLGRGEQEAVARHATPAVRPGPNPLLVMSAEYHTPRGNDHAGRPQVDVTAPPEAAAATLPKLLDHEAMVAHMVAQAAAVQQVLTTVQQLQDAFGGLQATVAATTTAVLELQQQAQQQAQDQAAWRGAVQQQLQQHTSELAAAAGGAKAARQERSAMGRELEGVCEAVQQLTSRAASLEQAAVVGGGGSRARR